MERSQTNYNRASVCLYVCSRFPPRRLAPRAPNFQGRPVASFSQGGNHFPKTDYGAPQVQRGHIFLIDSRGRHTFTRGSYFSKQTPWGATSSHGLYNCEKHSHVSKSKLMSHKRSQMLRSSVIIFRNYTSLCVVSLIRLLLGFVSPPRIDVCDKRWRHSAEPG